MVFLRQNYVHKCIIKLHNDEFIIPATLEFAEKYSLKDFAGTCCYITFQNSTLKIQSLTSHREKAYFPL